MPALPAVLSAVLPAMIKSLGWHSRGYLPHFDGGGIPQFVTFRLKDSLPQTVLERWRKELEGKSLRNSDAVLRKRIEAYLDQSYGQAYLKNPRVAALVQRSLLFNDGSRYRLFAWVVMPNHVHMLLTPGYGQSLSAILHSIKSYTASAVNRMLGRASALWQEESFDRYIRDSAHFEKTTAYIENNPVKARLCARANEWRFGSARLRHRR